MSCLARLEIVLRLSLLVLIAIAIGGATACGPKYDPSKEVVLLPFPEDGGAVLWDGWAGGFVRDYCVECHQPSAPCGGNGCHATGDPALWDFHDESAVIDRAATIQCGVAAVQDPTWNCSTAPKTFPIIGDNPLPTDEQRALIVGWIDAGCP